VAETYLPYSVNGRADLITAINFDGNFDMTDNWNSLSDYSDGEISDHIELSPLIYYSVVWSEKYWFVTYAFYHPRDYAGNQGVCCDGGGTGGDSHEHDLEGAIIIVDREDFIPKGVGTISHSHLLKSSISGTPEIFIDNRGHAVEANLSLSQCISDFENPCDNCRFFDNSHIIYDFTEDPAFVDGTLVGVGISGTGGYNLEDIFGAHLTSLHNLRNDPYVFSGDIFTTQSPTDCTDWGGFASAPWGWSQMDYSETDLNDFLNDVGLDAISNILYNPYFNECDLNRELHVLSNNQEFSTVQQYKKIIINENVVVNLKDTELKMETDGEIFLKSGSSLNLDNTTITSCKEGAIPWKGIYALEGGPPSLITMVNGSKIKYSKYGITNTLKVETPNAWEIPSHFHYNIGGSLMLIIKNSFFENNEICLTIIPHNGNPNLCLIDYSTFSNNELGLGIFYNYINPVFFRNNTFTDNSQSISIYKNLPDIKITDNTFLNDDIYSIEIEDSEDISIERNRIEGNEFVGLKMMNSKVYVANGNEFVQNDKALTSSGTHPMGSQVQIGDLDNAPNIFEYNEDNLFLGGNNSAAQTIIENNIVRFSNSTEPGIDIYGANHIRVNNNLLDYLNRGMYMQHTGDYINQIECNEFGFNQTTDLLVQYENSQTEILQNDFIGAFPVNGNIYMTQNAEILGQQGSLQNPADNCFDGLTDLDINTFSNNSFMYFHFENLNANNCETPEQTNGFAKISTDQTGLNCPVGIGPTQQPNDPSDHEILPPWDGIDCCETFYCCIDGLDDLINQILNTGGDNPYTYIDEETSSFTNFELQQQIDQWINNYIYYLVSNDQTDLATSFLVPFKKWKWQVLLFGLYVENKEYATAQTLLSTLPSNTFEEVNFKFVQSLYLNHSDVSKNYSVSENELLQLENIALSISPSAGYAHSLYFKITSILLDLPDIKFDNRITENRSSLQDEGTINLYPNPVKDYIQIENSSAFDIENLEIYSLSGTKIIQITDKMESNKIDVSQLRPGMYIVIINFGEEQKEFKIMKL